MNTILEKKLLEKLIRLISDGWNSGEIFSTTNRNNIEFLSCEDISAKFKGIIRTSIGKINTGDICIIDDKSVLQIVPRDVPRIVKKLEERLRELNSPKVEVKEEETVNA